MLVLWQKIEPLRRSKILVCLLALSSFGCATVSKKPEVKVPPEKVDFFSRWTEKADSWRTVSGEGLFTTQHQGSNVTLPLVILAQWPDQLRLEVQDPIGGTLALLILQGDRFWLYDQTAKQNYSGRLSSHRTGLLPPWTKTLFVQALLARPAQDQGSRLVWDSAGYLKEWKLDPEGGSVQYDDYKVEGKTAFARRVRFQKSSQNYLLQWKEWNFRSIQKKFYQIPPEDDFGRKTKALP